MFGFGKKKKLQEFESILSQLGNITATRANQYVEDNRQKIMSAFSRGLDPLSAVGYIAETEMERLQIAHQLKEPELANELNIFCIQC